MSDQEKAPEADVVSTRRDGDATVYSAHGVDLFRRHDAGPERYTLLHDFPRFGWAVGEHKALSSADDACALAAARELAKAL